MNATLLISFCLGQYTLEIPQRCSGHTDTDLLTFGRQYHRPSDIHRLISTLLHPSQDRNHRDVLRCNGIDVDPSNLLCLGEQETR